VSETSEPELRRNSLQHARSSPSPGASPTSRTSPAFAVAILVIAVRTRSSRRSQAKSRHPQRHVSGARHPLRRPADRRAAREAGGGRTTRP
jgi:hypothetical protein